MKPFKTLFTKIIGKTHLHLASHSEIDEVDDADQNDDQKIDDDSVKKVCSLVQLDSLIAKLPLGYQSMIEENGFNFSRGERQKILLARALLKNSDIYIFDEAFHQIDIEQEGIILKNIFSYLNGKTVIVISHRLQHLELYDKKYRLEKGCVHEF